MIATGSSPSGGGTIAKGFELLRTVGTFPLGATAAEIAARVDHPFPTTYRLLGSLVSTGFVEYDPSTRRYSLGLPVFELGQRVANARGFSATIEPVMQRLTSDTGESCLLAVLDGQEMLTVHTADGPQFRITTDPGDRVPLHTSAIGKMLLASLPAAERTELIDALELTPRTAHSIADRAVLARQVAEAAERGWAVQTEENDAGTNALAVPLRRSRGRGIAALGLAAPIFHADIDALLGHLATLRAAAERLSVTLP
jgi:DNA-binding IclR family transcriptional regulator